MLILNPDQEAAADAFTAFMASNDSEMVLSGPAGTGKTTLLKHLMGMKDPAILCSLLNKRPIVDWKLTATTNKAAEVLQETTGIEATTIHSLLGLRVTNDFENGTVKLSRKGNADVLTDTLVVIDECSMIDSELRDYIRKCTFNCKFIFIGDHCQMAPIKEPLSPVFAQNEPIYLNTIVRSQHTPDITELCQQLRETVETGVFHPMAEVPGVIDYLDPEEAAAEIERVFLETPDVDARILCYRNSTVLGMNGYLREKRNLPDRLTAGERVVSNSMVFGMGSQSTRGQLRVEQDVQLLNVNEADETYDFHSGGHVYKLPVYVVHTKYGAFRVPVDMDEYRGLIRETARAKAWQAHFGLKENVADLRPRDACTVYKAQGSTYHTSFVHLADIGTCTNPSQAARMLYVACSRATHHIRFIGKLPPRFG